MKIFIAKKVLLLIPLLCGITLLTFFLTKSIPGDPVFGMVGERASPETLHRVRTGIGADQDVIRQYLRYITLLFQGDMGRSYYTNRKVMEEILVKFPNTLKLAISAMIIAVPLGLILGFIAAFHNNKIADHVISGFSLVGLSIPTFWNGLMLMLLFGILMKVLPPSGTGGFRHLLLPAITLSLPAMGAIVRITRAIALDVLNMHFVRTAMAKGISRKNIYTVHVLKNSLIPLIIVIGLEFGSYLNGAVLTETIFGWDGIGRYAMEGIMRRDYPVIVGCIIVGTTVFVLLNLLVDILAYAVDPRMRVHGLER